MKLVNYSGFCRDCKHVGLEYAAQHSRALGLDAVEFLNFVLMDEYSPSEKYSVGETKKILDTYGLEVSCYSVCVDLLPENARTVDLMRRQIEFAGNIDCLRRSASLRTYAYRLQNSRLPQTSFRQTKR